MATKTSTDTEVRSPTSTKTSTDAVTRDNVTVTGGAGDGATNVTINPRSSMDEIEDGELSDAVMGGESKSKKSEDDEDDEASEECMGELMAALKSGDKAAALAAYRRLAEEA